MGQESPGYVVFNRAGEGEVAQEPRAPDKKTRARVSQFIVTATLLFSILIFLKTTLHGYIPIIPANIIGITAIRIIAALVN